MPRKHAIKYVFLSLRSGNLKKVNGWSAITPGRHGNGRFGGWRAETGRADTERAGSVDGWRRLAGQTRGGLVRWMDGGDSPGRHGERLIGGRGGRE